MLILFTLSAALAVSCFNILINIIQHSPPPPLPVRVYLAYLTGRANPSPHCAATPLNQSP